MSVSASHTRPTSFKRRLTVNCSKGCGLSLLIRQFVRYVGPCTRRTTRLSDPANVGLWRDIRAATGTNQTKEICARWCGHPAHSHLSLKLCCMNSKAVVWITRLICEKHVCCVNNTPAIFLYRCWRIDNLGRERKPKDLFWNSTLILYQI